MTTKRTRSRSLREATTTVPQSHTATVTTAWRCPRCRARGVITASSSTINQAIKAAHESKQPRCAGVAIEVHE
jgi:hypothetical protein